MYYSKHMCIICNIYIYINIYFVFLFVVLQLEERVSQAERLSAELLCHTRTQRACEAPTRMPERAHDKVLKLARTRMHRQTRGRMRVQDRAEIEGEGEGKASGEAEETSVTVCCTCAPSAGFGGRWSSG